VNESRLYFFLTLLAFGLIAFGGYLIKLGSFFNIVGGVVSAVLGFALGIILYGEKWNWWN
jgi:hypothetical protein